MGASTRKIATALLPFHRRIHLSWGVQYKDGSRNAVQRLPPVHGQKNARIHAFLQIACSYILHELA